MCLDARSTTMTRSRRARSPTGSTSPLKPGGCVPVLPLARIADGCAILRLASAFRTRCAAVRFPRSLLSPASPPDSASARQTRPTLPAQSHLPTPMPTQRTRPSTTRSSSSAIPQPSERASSGRKSWTRGEFAMPRRSSKKPGAGNCLRMSGLGGRSNSSGRTTTPSPSSRLFRWCLSTGALALPRQKPLHSDDFCCCPDLSATLQAQADALPRTATKSARRPTTPSAALRRGALFPPRARVVKPS